MANTQVLNAGSGNMSSAEKTKRGTVVFGTEERRGNRGVENTINVLVLDKSESTDDAIGHGDPRKKIVGIMEAASMFAMKLHINAYLAIIAFSTIARLICPMQKVGNNKLQLIKAVQGLTPDAATSTRESLELAETQFVNAPSGYTKRLHLLTDGMHNSGDPVSIAERLKQQGVQLNMIGFGEGDEIDADVLRQMASLSTTGTPLFYHFTDAKLLTQYFKRETQTITS